MLCQLSVLFSNIISIYSLKSDFINFYYLFICYNNTTQNLIIFYHVSVSSANQRSTNRIHEVFRVKSTNKCLQTYLYWLELCSLQRTNVHQASYSWECRYEISAQWTQIYRTLGFVRLLHLPFFFSPPIPQLYCY